jgi:hypothetical protein
MGCQQVRGATAIMSVGGSRRTEKKAMTSAAHMVTVNSVIETNKQTKKHPVVYGILKKTSEFICDSDTARDPNQLLYRGHGTSSPSLLKTSNYTL